MAKRTTTPVIVVGYDGSESSQKALAFAKELAQNHGAAIELQHIVDWSPFEYYSLEETAIQMRERKAQIQNDRESLFPPVLADLEKCGITANANVTFGSPPQVIARVAKNIDALMIVVGRQGRSKIRRLLLGSVASSVANHANCPVVIVP
ncbi:MAG: universal stress protein [Lysobacterales bacterium]